MHSDTLWCIPVKNSNDLQFCFSEVGTLTPVQTSLTVNAEFDERMADNSSEQYKKIEGDVMKMVRARYSKEIKSNKSQIHVST